MKDNENNGQRLKSISIEVPFRDYNPRIVPIIIHAMLLFLILFPFLLMESKVMYTFHQVSNF